jgi:hypothetical protein
VQLVRLAQRVLEEQLAQRVQQAAVAVEVEHDLVLVHLVSAHVMMLLKLNSSTYLLADNSQ